jgi:hypothetical protein
MKTVALHYKLEMRSASSVKEILPAMVHHKGTTEASLAFGDKKVSLSTIHDNHLTWNANECSYDVGS